MWATEPSCNWLWWTTCKIWFAFCWNLGLSDFKTTSFYLWDLIFQGWPFCHHFRLYGDSNGDSSDQGFSRSVERPGRIHRAFWQSKAPATVQADVLRHCRELKRRVSGHSPHLASRRGELCLFSLSIHPVSHFIFLSGFVYQVSTAYVRGWGTLLLNAVCENKLDFLRLLLEYGFVCFNVDIAKQQFWIVIRSLVSGLIPLPKLMVMKVRVLHLNLQRSTNATKRWWFYTSSWKFQTMWNLISWRGWWTIPITVERKQKKGLPTWCEPCQWIW